MKYQKTYYFLVLLVSWSQVLLGASLKGPERVEPGAMFVVQTEFVTGENQPASVEFDPLVLQFLGAVVPSPDLQARDRSVEILPGTGNGGSRSFALKFLPVAATSSTDLLLKIAERGQSLKIHFQVPEVKTGYHMHFLVAGLFLVALGIWFWRTQKKSVGLMSTRSLFLNFEELEKARAGVFPEKLGGPAKEAPSPATDSAPAGRVSPPSPVSPMTPASPISPSPPAIPPASPIAGAQPEAPKPISSSQPTLAGSAVATAAPAPISTGSRIDGPEPVPEMTTAVEEPAAPPVCGNPTVERRLAPLPGQEPVAAAAHSSEAKTMDKPSGTAGSKIRASLTDSSGKTFAGTGGDEITVGRRNTCTIVLTASEVSRNHCALRRVGAGWVVVPQTADNRTEVNGTLVTQSAPCPIKTGDILSLGGTPFTFRIGE